MPRNMSFSITTEQIRNRTKTVTRRKGWKFLKVGDIVNACVKCMGLKPGEKIERLCQIRITGVRRELLSRMLTANRDYGFTETTLEGFPEGHRMHWPTEFVRMFCAHMGGDDFQTITRIEFEFLDTPNKESEITP